MPTRPMRSAIITLFVALAAAKPLPRCTIAVAGANGRVGSMVCRELLRKHKQVTVRALVRSASDPYQGYGRLSYEVGAEDGKMELRPAWQINEDGVMGAASIEFDEDVQGGYGLDRLEIRECELRYKRDVDDALADVDAVIYCASAFNSFRQRLPDKVDDAANSIAQAGMNLFELRFGKALFGEPDKEDGSDAPRREAARDKTADVEGVANAAAAMASTRRRRSTLAQLTGGGGSGLANVGELPPLVLLSSAGSLGYDEDTLSGELRENEFGFRKRQGEEAVRGSDLEESAVIVRSAAIDDVRGEEGLEVSAVADPDAAARAAVRAAVAVGAEDADGAVGTKADKEVKRRRIHPRDLAVYLVACLCGEAQAGSQGGSDAAGSTLDKEIAALEKEKAAAVAEQEFLKAGELVEKIASLKEQLGAGAGIVSNRRDPEKRITAGGTVDVWTYLQSGPFA